MIIIALAAPIRRQSRGFAASECLEEGKKYLGPSAQSGRKEISMNEAEPARREFLYIATAMAGAIGLGAFSWPFIDQMRPDASTRALASIEIDVSSLVARMSLTVKWRGRPVFIRNRTAREIEAARATALDELKDPLARNANLVGDQPATDANRSAGDGKENWLVIRCLHALGMRSSGPGGQFRRLVLSLSRIATTRRVASVRGPLRRTSRYPSSNSSPSR